MDEIWKPCTIIPGLEDVQVSNLGNTRIASRIVPYITKKGVSATQTRAAKNTSPWISKNGYYTISVKRNGERKKYLVHRLVALALIPTEDVSLSINHIDCNKLNNKVENLEWCTLAENTRMQWRDGLANLRGNAHPGAKLRSEFIPKIRSLQGKQSAASVAKEYGVSASAISLVWQRQRWAAV